MRCAGPHWEGDEPKPMMNEREKSVPVVVAVKSMNEAGQPAEEWMEPRAGAKGNAGQQSTLRTQRRGRVSHALGRIRQAVYARFAVKYPRVGAVCGKAARTGSVRGAHSNMRPYRDLSHPVSTHRSNPIDHRKPVFRGDFCDSGRPAMHQ
jgi:hypothetical protein